MRSKIESLQVMRGVAALSIVYYHTEYGFWHNANWGIDFFLILSAFLLTYTTNESNNDSKRYWVNKLTKIVPLYWLTTLLVSVIVVIKPEVFRSSILSAETLIKSLFFIPCYCQGGRIYPIYSIGWTLNYEIFFYLIFFMSMRIWYKHRNMLCLAILLALTLIGLVYTGGNAMILFWTDLRMLDFVSGILLAVEWKRLESACDMRLYNKRIFWVGGGISILLLYAERVFIGKYNMAWNIFFSLALIIVAMLYKQDRFPRIFVYLGDMSYSMYLIHFFIVGVAARLLIDNTVISIKNTIVIVLAIIIAVIASSLCYELFEKRVTRLLRGVVVKGAKIVG